MADIERGHVKIPQFQRDFVWPIQQSAALIDSVLKGYPVGTFIFWSTKERLRSVRDIGGAKLPQAKTGETVSFVLDGQQRLTSLYAAIRGLKVEREDGRVDDFTGIYIDLNADEHDQVVVTDTTTIAPEAVLPLRTLLTGTITQLATIPTKYHEKVATYQRQMQGYDFSIIQVREVPIDVATEIFTRINVGGKALSVFEIMVAKTYDEDRDFDLSVAFDNLLKRIHEIDYDTISDTLVLQIVALILRKECKRQTILNLKKSEFIDAWPAAVDALERAIDYFRLTYRIPASRLLPYNTLLAPFAYFFHHHAMKPDADQRKQLEDFFWRCSLSERYSSAVESKLAQDARRVDQILVGKTAEYDWNVDASPTSVLNDGWFNTGRSRVKAILCLFAFYQPKSFNDNAVVTIRNDWLKQVNSRNYHHFFPRSWLAKRGEEDWRANNIVNITIIDDHLNKAEIGAKPPATYMKRFEKTNGELAETMRSHLIDDLESFGVFDNDFNTFLERRAAAISVKLRKRLIPRSGDKFVDEED